MADIGAALDRKLRAEGLAIDGVSIGDPANKATWTVHPPNLQAQAQPFIDAFNPNDPLNYPRYIHRLEIVRRLSAQTKQRMMNMALTNLIVAEWWSRLMAGGSSSGNIDVHGAEWVQGKAAIQAAGIGVGKIWDTQAAFNAEAATVEG